MAVRCTDLHNDVANDIGYFVNDKIRKHTLFSLPEMSTDFVLKQLRIISNYKSTGLGIISMISVNTVKLAAHRSG